MQIFVIDTDADVLTILRARVKEALRQTGLKRTNVVCGGFEILSSQIDEGEPSYVGILGPGCYQQATEAVSTFRSFLPTAPLALVLDNDTYATEAIELRREVNARIMPIGDIVQLVQFLLDATSVYSSITHAQKGVISTVHFKGGVGATTVAVGLASVWARQGLSVALIDLDDVNPQLSAWGRVPGTKRELVGDLLREGGVPKSRINEVVHPVEGYDGGLVVVGQPEQYQYGFHFKADVLDGVASASVFIQSLVDGLRDEFDLIVVDGARSWGIATFSLLPMSQQILLVIDDDGLSVRRSLDCLRRMCQESDDPAEFDLTRWRVVLNGYTGRLLSPTDVGNELGESGLFPEASELFTLPFSETGRQWGAPGVSFYDCADEATRLIMRDIAFGLVPFRQSEESQTATFRIVDNLKKFLGLSKV